ncbi:hypothetical protein NT01EI_0499 [Edwardsiella ictaluri 93-146]|uniref:Uncharacterized protein n=1 Tax=Edwardsiella ictaluri (strain 93-146) TaxID=634503 RepID=C5BH51_EDWI9|nr:hypothetical protein NT01EI_0499 [Edwardsiella ictaluri 93-146]STP87275.1 Hexuronate transporter [Edwardsiella ictaluri]
MFKAYGFNLQEIAMFAWIPVLFADLGCVIGGYPDSTVSEVLQIQPARLP